MVLFIALSRTINSSKPVSLITRKKLDRAEAPFLYYFNEVQEALLSDKLHSLHGEYRYLDVRQSGRRPTNLIINRSFHQKLLCEFFHD